MNELIKRYVYDVTRRLPERDRAEVEKELLANIYDMLPDSPAESEVREVLNGLGSPAELANKYRTSPNYLISPAIYDDYIRAIKWILPLVGIIAMAAGMVFGAIDSIKDEFAEISVVISSLISNGIGMGLSAAMQVLIWTTIGFAIADRTKHGAKNTAWSVDSLPELPPDGKKSIRLSDMIVEIAFEVFFSVLFIWICLGKIPIAFVFVHGDIQVRSVFNDSFLNICAIAIAVSVLFDLIEFFVKLKYRSWTPPVCIAEVLTHLVGMGVWVYAFSRPGVFSGEFIEFLQGIEWGTFDIMRFIGDGGVYMAFTVIIVIVAASLAGIANALVKTLRR